MPINGSSFRVTNPVYYVTTKWVGQILIQHQPHLCADSMWHAKRWQLITPRIEIQHVGAREFYVGSEFGPNHYIWAWLTNWVNLKETREFWKMNTALGDLDHGQHHQLNTEHIKNDLLWCVRFKTMKRRFRAMLHVSMVHCMAQT